MLLQCGAAEALERIFTTDPVVSRDAIAVGLAIRALLEALTRDDATLQVRSCASHIQRPDPVILGFNLVLRDESEVFQDRSFMPQDHSTFRIEALAIWDCVTLLAQCAQTTTSALWDSQTR